MSDDHATNAISLYESRLASVFKTPHIDRIGTEGFIAHRCYCTNSICTPSRATILTGQHSHTNGVRVLLDPLPLESVNYPKLMQSNQYETAVIGKWHLNSEPQGFDHYDVLPGQGRYVNPAFIDDQSGFDWSTYDKKDFTQGTE